MNSELLDLINNEIDTLNEQITEQQMDVVVGLINEVDNSSLTNIKQFTENPWKENDLRWNKLLEKVGKTQGTDRQISRVIRIDNVTRKDASGNQVAIPADQSYLSFDKYSKTAKLGSREDATPVDNFHNSILAKNLVKWIRKSYSEADGYNFDKAKAKTDTVKSPKVNKKSQITYETIAELYFNIYSKEVKWDKVPQYWKVAISNDLKGEKNIISCDSLQFIIRTIGTSFQGTPMLKLLNDETTNSVLYDFLDQGMLNPFDIKIDGSNAESFLNSKFFVAALLSGCFSKFDEDEVWQLTQQYNKVKIYYDSAKQGIKDIIIGKTDDIKREVFAQHVILTKGELKDNPFIKYTEGGEQEEITLIESNNLHLYRAVTQDEIKYILQHVLDESKQARLKFWLVLDDDNYELKQNAEGTILSLANGNTTVKFFPNTVVKIVRATEQTISASNNLVKINEVNDNTVVIKDLKDSNVKGKDYFEIDSNGNLKVKADKDKGFKTNKFKAHIAGQGNDISIDKITIEDSLAPAGQKSEKQTSDDKGNNTNDQGENNQGNNRNGSTVSITDNQARDAIKKYLKKQGVLTRITGQGKHKAIDELIDNGNFKNKPISSRYQTLINRTIRDLQLNPDKYAYNSEVVQINKTDDTLLAVLIDLLNGNLEDAIDKQEAVQTGQNIPGIIVQNDKVGKVPELTANDIANKLRQYAAELQTDQTNGKNRVAQHAIEPIIPGELAKIISWFNNRYNPRNQVDVNGKPIDDGK